MISLHMCADSIFEPTDSTEFREYVHEQYASIGNMLEDAADFERDAIAEMAAEGLGDARSLFRDWWIDQVRDIVADMRHWWEGPDRDELQAENQSLREMISELRAAARQRDQELKVARDAADDLYHKVVRLQARAEAYNTPPLCRCGRISYEVYCTCGERLA
jgi:hypothetical protein